MTRRRNNNNQREMMSEDYEEDSSRNAMASLNRARYDADSTTSFGTTKTTAELTSSVARTDGESSGEQQQQQEAMAPKRLDPHVPHDAGSVGGGSNDNNNGGAAVMSDEGDGSSTLETGSQMLLVGLSDISESHMRTSATSSSGMERGTLTTGSEESKTATNTVRRRNSSITNIYQPSKRRTNSLDEFTIDKLNMAAVGLYGRDKEAKQLQQALREMQEQRKKVFVTVSGLSGTGKTALVQSALQGRVEGASNNNKNGIMVSGKFDLHLRNEPYAGIATACGDLCGQILLLRQNMNNSVAASSNARFEQIQALLLQDLQGEITFLAQMIPVLEELLDFSTPSSFSETNDNNNNQENDDDDDIMPPPPDLIRTTSGQQQQQQLNGPSSARDVKHRFLFAFQRFIRAVATCFDPLVMVLDDLQWADAPTMELLQGIMLDDENDNLMVVGIYRSNEVDETSSVSRLLADLASKQQQQQLAAVTAAAAATTTTTTTTQATTTEDAATATITATTAVAATADATTTKTATTDSTTTAADATTTITTRRQAEADDLTVVRQCLCPSCGGGNGVTKILLTEIPTFRQIMVMAFDCPDCGHKNSEVNFSGEIQPQGQRVTLAVRGPTDLNRQIVKSDSATLLIPEIEFEIPPSTQRGTISTLEGILVKSADALESQQAERLQLGDLDNFHRCHRVIQQLRQYAGKGSSSEDDDEDGNPVAYQPFTVVLDDPAGNSFIESTTVPLDDPQLETEQYYRTPNQDMSLGLQPSQQSKTDGSIDDSNPLHKNPANVSQGSHIIEDFDIGNAYQSSILGKDEPMIFPTPCASCQQQAETKMCVANIPNFKEVVIMAFLCPHCGFKSNEIKGGGAIPEYGSRITVTVSSSKDLAREVLKSDTAALRIPELDLELSSGGMGGVYSTIEGLLTKMHDQLKNTNPFGHGDSATQQHTTNNGGDFSEPIPRHAKFLSVLEKLQEMASGKHLPFTFVMVDPLANSFVGPPSFGNNGTSAATSESSDNDDGLLMEKYQRSENENEALGINDMRTEDYEEGKAASASDHTITKAEEQAPKQQNGETHKEEHVGNKTEPFALSSIEIGNLDFESIHKFVRAVLSMQDHEEETARTMALADICEKRTHGNAFFLQQFIKMLNEKKLIQFNLGQLRWEWEDSELQEQTHATDNVVDLLRSKMEALPETEILALQLASALGARFKRDFLVVLWDELCSDLKASSGQEGMVDRLSQLQDTLASFETEGFLHFLEESNEYQFTHDGVQEAAARLVASDKRQAFDRRVGGILLSRLPPDEVDSTVFIVVNLLNEGGARQEQSPTGKEQDIHNSTHNPDRLSLARLNLRACQKAVALSAFEAAASYAETGIKLVGVDGWEVDYELTLELYSIGIETEVFLGNFDLVEKYFNEVIAQEEYPLADKLRAYISYCDVMSGRGQPTQSTNLALSVLSKFGCKFPKSSLGIKLRLVGDVIFVKGLLDKNKLDKVAELPVDTDPTRLRLALFLDKLALHLYTINSPQLPLTIFRNVQWTIKNGLNDFSGASLASAGVALCGILWDLQGGAKYAKCALSLIKKLPPYSEVKIIFVCHAAVNHWTQPLRDQLKPLFRAYELGFRMGDTENACWAVQCFLIIRFLTSFSLDLLLSDSLSYLAQCESLQRYQAFRMGSAYTQLFATVAGKGCNPENTRVMHGDVLKARDAEEWYKEDSFFRASFSVCQAYVYTIYGDYVQCAEQALKLGWDYYTKEVIGAVMIYGETLSNGLSSIAAVRLTGKKKYLRTAKLVHKRVKSWIEKGNPNVGHIDALLDAEFAALKKRKFAALQKYEVAILVSARGGLLLDAGLCSERMADFLLEHGDHEDAKFRVQSAVKYYREVGALAKVSMLEAKYSNDIWPKPAEIVTLETDGT